MARKMAETNQANCTLISQWTSVQAYTLAVICLLVGIAGGWFIRGSESGAAASVASYDAIASSSTPASSATAAQTPTPAQMQKMADTQAAPLIEKLKLNPTNAEWRETIG